MNMGDNSIIFNIRGSVAQFHIGFRRTEHASTTIQADS
jgi:hypothetical protein